MVLDFSFLYCSFLLNIENEKKRDEERGLEMCSLVPAWFSTSYWRISNLHLQSLFKLSFSLYLIYLFNSCPKGRVFHFYSFGGAAERIPGLFFLNVHLATISFGFPMEVFLANEYGEVARGLVQNNSPRERTSPRKWTPRPTICFLMNYLWKIECFLEDLFLGGQRSIILGYRRLSVKSLLVCEWKVVPQVMHLSTFHFQTEIFTG